MPAASSAHSIRSRDCEDISISVASTRDQRRGAFALAYKSYLRAGLCGPSELGLRITPFQLTPATDVIVAELRGEVISTLSLVRDGEFGLPMESVYPEEINQRRSAGRRLAEVTCLADRRREPVRFFGLFCELSRVMVQMADREGVDQLLIAVHPRHARMYCRAMAFVQIGEDRGYPAVNGRPAVALCLDFHQVRTCQPELWTRFVGQPLPAEAVQSRPIDDADRRYFSGLLLGTADCEDDAQTLIGV